MKNDKKLLLVISFTSIAWAVLSGSLLSILILIAISTYIVISS
jgi:hypothetical protein